MAAEWQDLPKRTLVTLRQSFLHEMVIMCSLTAKHWPSLLTSHTVENSLFSQYTGCLMWCHKTLLLGDQTKLFLGDKTKLL